ncbi:Transposase [Acetobacteraceae bacterium EV16G]|uniref:Transposase n=1 Tax=Sorlinia euscelidii TaxID=3081148 RepID=A0ABU7U405_9PROT
MVTVGQRPWLTMTEIAALRLPDMPETQQGVLKKITAENWITPESEGQAWRRREGQGGGYEFALTILPLRAQIEAARSLQGLSRDPVAAAESETIGKRKRTALWKHFDTLPDKLKDKARNAYRILDAVEALVNAGQRKYVAMMLIASQERVSMRTIQLWYKRVRGLNKCDWLAALAPNYAKPSERVHCPGEAWDILRSDYLRRESPTFASCYARLVKVAEERGWTLPSRRTLLARMNASPVGMRVHQREGEDKLKALYPAQRRDHSVFHALEAVNADGHKFDVFVEWPIGNETRIVRPVLVGFQDIYSGKILSWRIDISENKESVRLAFGDMVEKYGIPKLCYLDNGRNFASKWLTGGVPNRYRFKVLNDEPLGIMPQLGVEVHWTKPYSGQSKPIERAWRDFASDIAKHPAFAGAYTGANPTAKPENYASKAVPLDRFIAVVSQGIADHNARTGRRSDVCKGKYSFDQVFEESYRRSVITKATEEQRRLWLLPAEQITVSRRDGVIEIEGNRYWAEFLEEHRGTKVVVRLDPQDLQADIHVYRSSGVYLGAAKCVAKTGFADKDAARRHQQARKEFIRANKLQGEAAKRLSDEELAAVFASLPKEEEPPLESAVTRMFTAPQVQGNTALATQFMAEADAQEIEEEEENENILRFLQRDR